MNISTDTQSWNGLDRKRLRIV